MSLDPFVPSPTRPPSLDGARPGLARLVLFAERAWPHLWPGLGWLGLFLAASLFGVWGKLPGWLHALALIGLAAALGQMAWRLARVIAWPGRREALRRLERDSHLENCPLASLEDALADRADRHGVILWQAYQARLANKVGRLCLAAPALSLVRVDPHALRMLIALLLVAGLLAAGGEVRPRLWAGFVPELGSAPANARLDAWITPPAYTGRPPIMLGSKSGQSATPIAVPAGSVLSALLKGGWRTPYARWNGARMAFAEVAPESYRLEEALASGQELVIGQGGRVHGRWTLEVVPDMAPIAVFPETPEATLNHALRIPYQAFDDYGLAALRLEIIGPGQEGEAPQVIDLPPPAMRDGQPGLSATYQDLTPSPWAGEEVRMMLVASDALGQVGRSLPLPVTLPERPFHHPVARALIEVRKGLLRRPDSRARQSQMLDAIAQAPDSFDNDLLVFTAVRAAHWRLVHNTAERALNEVADLLWDTAIHLEEGQLGAAQRDLRAAMEALMAALARDEKAKVAELMRQMHDKLGALMREHLARQGKAAPSGDMDAARLVDGAFLDRMLEQMQAMAGAGDMAGAMAMLAQLQNMMENLQIAGPMDAAAMERAMAANQALYDLDGLIEEQRQLLNETVRESLGQGLARALPGNREGGAATRGLDGLARRQQGLGEALGGVGETFSRAGLPAPRGLGEAGQAMGAAGAYLQQGEGIGAARHQGDALDALRAARQEAATAMAEAKRRYQAGGLQTDPLGRAGPGMLSNEDVAIPSADDMKRARAIVEELQRRLADPSRPATERAYLRRLLERF